MIKGIVALFSSGILTNPMILLGIVSGSLFYAYFDADKITQIYKTPSFYGVVLLVSCIYVIGFRKKYKSDGDIDWFETMLSVLTGVVKFVVAGLLMISFIYMCDMGDVSELNGNVEFSPQGF